MYHYAILIYGDFNVKFASDTINENYIKSLHDKAAKHYPPLHDKFKVKKVLLYKYLNDVSKFCLLLANIYLRNDADNIIDYNLRKMFKYNKVITAYTIVGKDYHQIRKHVLLCYKEKKYNV